MSSAGSVWYVEFTAAEHGRRGSSFMRKTRVNIAEYYLEWLSLYVAQNNEPIYDHS